MIVMLIIFLLILALLPANIAKEKGRDFTTWYIYGVLLFFFAMIHAIVLPENDNKARDEQNKKLSEEAKKLSENDDLFKPNIVDLDSPVEVIGQKIIGDINNINCVVKFKNLSSKPVIGVKYKIKCFDTFNEPVGENNEIIAVLQDVHAEAKECFGINKLVNLNNHLDTRSMEIYIMKVIFEDGEIWENTTNNIYMSNKNNIEDKEELNNLRYIFGKDANSYFKEIDDKWICICGRVNKISDYSCIRCNRIKDDISKFNNKEFIDHRLAEMNEKLRKEEEERILKEQQLLEEQRIKNIKTNKKLKRIFIYSIIIISFSCLTMFCINYINTYEEREIASKQKELDSQKYALTPQEKEAHALFLKEYESIHNEIIEYDKMITSKFTKTSKGSIEDVKDFEVTMRDSAIKFSYITPPDKYSKMYNNLVTDIQSYWEDKIMLYKIQIFDCGYSDEDGGVSLENSLNYSLENIKSMEDKLKDENYIPEE